ncbi:MAG: TfoX/Sxy family protein [Deltaproteobacteria bacterium]|nr:TfoX/Sxy family protein [Deltaproteobacteria bacterium]
MAWKKVSQELAELLEEAVRPYSALKKTMFGCPVFFTNGYMFAGAHQDTVILRLSDVDLARLFLECDKALPFEPMEGRLMKDYAALPETIYGDPALLDLWISRAHAHVMSLPPKAPKPPRAKKTVRPKTAR